MPFNNIDDINEIGYAGGNWFVMAKEQAYCLDSDMKWIEIEDFPISYISTVFQVNGYLALFKSYDGLYVSKDCEHWEKVSLPDDGDVIGLVYFKDKYVLFTQGRRTYTYKVKGFIFDSEEEGSCYSTIAWQSSSILKGWEKWSDASYTYEGMELNSKNIAANESLIVAGFSYGTSYKYDKKKSSANACVAYFTNSRWKDASCLTDSSNHGEFYFLHNHGIFINTYYPALISENVYEWKPLAGTKPKEQG